MQQGNVFLFYHHIQYMKSSCDNIPVVDKIIRICSALNNLCVSAVPFT